MRGADWAANNGDVPRGSCALYGAPNWLVAESVSTVLLVRPSLRTKDASEMPKGSGEQEPLMKTLTARRY